ncbi:MAG: vanadium-dependent haloperoxidase [Crocinitomicaceae bacterium]
MKIYSLALLSISMATIISCESSVENTKMNPAADEAKIIEEKKGKENVAYTWGYAALQGTAMDTERFKPRPTVTSRYLGLIFTAIFDAWTRYDEKAIPIIADGVERRPIAEHNIANKEKAISYAAYRTLCEYYYSDSVYFQGVMKDLGYDFANKSIDPSTPEGIGNLVANAIIEARKNDGSNQYGMVADSNGEPYFDYTNYSPTNPVDKMVDLKRWQPKYFLDEMGKKYEADCLTPYWQHVEPLVLDSASQFRSIAPPAMDSEQLRKELKEVVSIQENMTDHDKALVEFMRDGPQSVQQAGHWLKFAQSVSRRDNHTLDEDVKMYFLVQATAMDGFIACWDTKMHYDYARPYALVHNFYKGKTITGWKGEGKGFGEIKGEEWVPYSPAVFLCPPFPAYVSGHSTISGGCAEALLLYTGAEHFGDSAKVLAGELTEIDPQFYGDTITLRFPTFTEAAEMAGQSRVMGGYHIQADNVAGLKLGRDIAHKVWDFYNMHLGN